VQEKAEVRYSASASARGVLNCCVRFYYEILPELSREEEFDYKINPGSHLVGVGLAGLNIVIVNRIYWF
jgi:hypothetical protein